MLGELEQLVLLALLRVGDDAYAVPVHEALLREGRDLTLGTIYKSLARLEAKDLVTSRTGEATAVRGGRRKRLYTVTAAGRAAVRQSLATIRRLAAGLDFGTEAR